MTDHYIHRHYGQRDYKCGVCDFFGYTFTDIRKHIERKHQDIKYQICDKCNKHFRSEYALKVSKVIRYLIYLGTVHDILYSFQCCRTYLFMINFCSHSTKKQGIHIGDDTYRSTVYLFDFCD